MALLWPTITTYISFDNTRWYDDGVCTWTSVSTRFKRASYRRGKQRQLGTPQAGPLTLVLDNADGALDPDNTASALYGTMVAGCLVWIRCTYNSVVYDLFKGQVTAWDTAEIDRGSEPEVTIQAVDYLAQIGRARLISGAVMDAWNGEMVDWWFERYSSNYYSTTSLPTAIDRGSMWIEDMDDTPGNGALDGDATYGVREVLDQLMKAETESTYFFNGAGTFVYHDHNRRHGVQPVIQAVFDNDTAAQALGALPFEDVTLTNDDTDVKNDAEISRAGSATAVTESPLIAVDSQRRYGFRTEVRSIPRVSSADARSLADQIIYLYQTAVPRITSITVNGMAQVEALWVAILNLEISDPIRIRRRPYPVPGNTTLRDYFIEGYSVDIVLDGAPSWQVTYDVSPAVDGVHGPLIGGTGVAFPSAPATDDLFYRTDLDGLYLYDGTRWVSEAEYPMTLGPYGAAPPFSATGAILLAPTWEDASPGVYITRLRLVTVVLTTNNGSNYWNFEFRNAAGTVLQSFNTSADSASASTLKEFNINSAQTTGYCYLQATSKTGAPGNLQVVGGFFYRKIAT